MESIKRIVLCIFSNYAQNYRRSCGHKLFMKNLETIGITEFNSIFLLCTILVKGRLIFIICIVIMVTQIVVI